MNGVDARLGGGSWRHDVRPMHLNATPSARTIGAQRAQPENVYSAHPNEHA